MPHSLRAKLSSLRHNGTINDNDYKRLCNALDLEKQIDEPIRPRGHWIECEDEVKVYCSECKEISDYPTNYCQNCGAKMVEPKESEDKA